MKFMLVLLRCTRHTFLAASSLSCATRHSHWHRGFDCFALHCICDHLLEAHVWVATLEHGISAAPQHRQSTLASPDGLGIVLLTSYPYQQCTT